MGNKQGGNQKRTPQASTGSSTVQTIGRLKKSQNTLEQREKHLDRQILQCLKAYVFENSPSRSFGMSKRKNVYDRLLQGKGEDEEKGQERCDVSAQEKEDVGEESGVLTGYETEHRAADHDSGERGDHVGDGGFVGRCKE